MLTLVCDMDAFCRAIRWISLEAPCLGTIILKQKDNPDAKLQTFSDKTVKKEFRLRVEFRSTTYVPMTPTLEQTLVGLIADLRIPGQKVNLKGATALSNTEQYLRRTAGAPIIFITALVWDMIETARIQMATAHGLVRDGKCYSAYVNLKDYYSPLTLLNNLLTTRLWT